MQNFQFRITGEEAGRRLDEFLWSRFGGLSRMRIASLVGEGACLVNGVAARAGYHIEVDDFIEIAFEGNALTAMSPELLPLEIVYEDDHLIVVIKPSGMVVHPTLTVKSGTLANALAYHFNRDFYNDSPRSLQSPAHGEAHSLVRPGIIHRLDRATSGLMVVARTKRALSLLSRHFHRRLVEKRYLALIHGGLSEDSGAIIAPIGRDPERRPQWWVMEEGKPSETRFRVLERTRLASLIEMEPVTGRTNQLRIHCAYAGHPIFGDELYGESAMKVEQGEIPAPPPRLCLHASRLAFHHPANGEWMEFASPLPEEVALYFALMKSDA